VIRENELLLTSASLLGLERHVAKQRGGEVGEWCQVRRAWRAQQPYLRGVVVVEGVDDAFGEQGTHTDGALAKPVGQAQHRCAHDIGGDRRAVPIRWFWISRRLKSSISSGAIR
jgi:hypothetical protein